MKMGSQQRIYSLSRSREMKPVPVESRKTKAVPIEIEHSHESTVREMITREDELTNQRMLWMAAFNGLLFAALGFAWEKADARFFAIVLSALGIASSFLNGLSLTFSAGAQRRLLLWWHNEIPQTYYGPGVMGAEPTDKRRLAFFFAPWILLAFAFVVGWVAILIYVCRYVH
jgi:hypothetical protein